MGWKTKAELRDDRESLARRVGLDSGPPGCTVRGSELVRHGWRLP